MERIWKALESPQPNLVINSSVRSKIHTRRRKRPVSDLGARFSLKIFPFSSSPGTQTSIYFNFEFGPWCNRIACALVHSPTSQIIPISQAPKIVPPIDGNAQLINTHECSFFRSIPFSFSGRKLSGAFHLGGWRNAPARTFTHTRREMNIIEFSSIALLTCSQCVIALWSVHAADWCQVSPSLFLGALRAVVSH
jgi:hypothetical protein